MLLARGVDRVGKGIRGAPRDALIADSTEAPFRGRAFGFHRAADTMGAVVGPLLAVLLVWLLGLDYRWIFALAFLPGVLSVLAMRLARDVPRPRAGSSRPRAWIADRRFQLYLAVLAVFALGNSSDVFLILRAKDLGLGDVEVVLAYVVYNLVYAGVSLPAGHLSDRVGRLPVLTAGLAVFAAVYLGFAVADEGRWIWPLFAVYGIYIAATDGVAKAFVVDLVPAEHRAAALGAHGALMAAFILLASVTAGLLWDTVSPAAPFLLGATTAGAAAVLLPLLCRRPRLISPAAAG